MSKRIELELWEVERLIPYAKNAKKHSKDQVVTLAGLIQKYGFTQPILVDAKGSIVAGHGRAHAARAGDRRRLRPRPHRQGIRGL
jgi:ParB-like chromosome segregation protein Spo0J